MKSGWAVTRAGLIRFDPDTETSISYKHDPANPHSISDNRVYSFLEKSPGKYWIGTFGGGLNIFDLQEGTFTAYQENPQDPHSISHNFIRDMYRDRSNIVWIATNGGISKSDLKPPKFRHVKRNPLDPQSLKSNMILAIYSDADGTSWVGHNAGLNVFDKENNPIGYFPIPHNNPRSGSGFVNAICRADSQNLWIGTLGGGLYLFDKEKGIKRQYLHKTGTSNSLGSNLITSLATDRYGQLWIGTRRGIDRFNTKSGTFRHYATEAVVNRSQVADILSIYRDRDQEIWVTTWKGLFRYDEAADAIVRFEATDETLNNALNLKVNGIYQHQDGNYWVATENGLIEMSIDGRMFRHLTELDGLPSSYTCGVIGDEAGNLWISSFFGFVRYNAAAHNDDKLRIFTEADGLQSNEFNVGATFRNPANGELFFGGINGFNRFFPAEVKDNPAPPPVALTAFKKFDRTVLSGQALLQARTIELDHNDQYFAFEFSALDYTISEKNQYAYKMSGFNDRWIYSGARRFASYTNLDAGEYRFLVRAANNDGIWNEEGVDLRIVIHPPFWETWWFRLLVATLLSVALWMAYRARIRKLLALERMRVQIASDLHDDIGSSLTKIALYADVIHNNDDRTERNRLLTKIGSMSRELVVTMSDIVWSIDARNDTFADLLDRMHDFAAGLLTAREIEYSINVSGVRHDQKVPANTRQNLYLIYKEALNNVARHSGASEVKINLRQEGSEFRLSVWDNGRGHSDASRKSGHGLRNMQMRAERLGGAIDLKDNDGLELELRIEKI